MIIESKMPLWVLTQLYIIKDSSPAWDSQLLLTHLDVIITRQETAKALLGDHRDSKPNPPQHRSGGSAQQPRAPPQGATSALVAHSKPASNQTKKKGNKIPRSPCAFCSELHFHDKCTQYATVQARQTRIKQANLCWKCLKADHRTNECTAKVRPCYYCKGTHHSALCFKAANKASNSQTPIPTLAAIQSESPDVSYFPPDAFEDTTSVTAIAHTTPPPTQRSQHHTILPCRTCVISNPEDSTRHTKALVFFDTGSHRSYILSDLANRLKLRHLAAPTL